MKRQAQGEDTALASSFLIHENMLLCGLWEPLFHPHTFLSINKL